MEYRVLGKTGVRVSAIALGAGPVPGVMVGADERGQVETVRRAIEVGINWIDTAAGYGEGRSEAALGRAMRSLGAADKVHVATKVRFIGEDLHAIERRVRESVRGSLERLGVSRVTLLQVHNSITGRRGDEPTSITPGDVLGKGGVIEAMEKLKQEGVVGHVGITGIGQAGALREVVRSGRVETIQVPYHLLNPSAGRRMREGFSETDYGGIIEDCAEMGMGVFVIRVFAGGALAGCEPSAHTYKTPFFPLALYERDQARARALAKILGDEMELKEAAVRFAIGNRLAHSAIVGFSGPGQVDEAVAAMGKKPLSAEVYKRLEGFWDSGGAG